ncbi:MAG: hypothetical protein ACRC0F_10320 [Cetobacterium sp.]
MFFFDDFIKKIAKTKIEFRTKRKYRLEVKKLIMWIGTGLPLVLLGLLQGYMGYIKEFSIPYLGLGVLLIFLGLKHLKNIFTYKIVLDFENKRMIGEGLDLDLRDIETCVLKEGVVGKGNRLQVIIRIVTKDKREIIIPLIMGNKVDFICALRDELKEKFSIKK